MTARFFCPAPLPDKGRFELPREVAHHAAKVLRIQAGERIVLFDGGGREVSAVLATTGPGASVDLIEWSQPQRESPLEVVLAQALASGDKMDWVVQKAVELGVAAIVPLETERCVLRLSGERAEKKVRHWQQIVVSACEQSGRNRLPVLEPPVELPRFLQRAAPVGGRLVLAPGSAQRLGGRLRPAGRCELLVGPEGGWSERELALFDQPGCERVGLGPRVLRTETAGLAALAAMQACWGDL